MELQSTRLTKQRSALWRAQIRLESRHRQSSVTIREAISWGLRTLADTNDRRHHPQ